MTGNLYIFDNSGRNTYQRSTTGTLMDKYFVIKTSNQESLNHLVPLDIAGAYVDINDNNKAYKAGKNVLGFIDTDKAAEQGKKLFE